MFAFVILLIMLTLSFIHLFWGHGGNWPGINRQDLVDKVVGEGTQFPSIFACYAVAITLIIAGLIPILSTSDFIIPRLQYLSWMNYLIAIIFLIRGLGGYLPIIEKRWVKIFVHYNRIIYSPLCMILAICYIFFGTLNH